MRREMVIVGYLAFVVVACGIAQDGAGDGGDCRKGEYACSAGFACVQSGGSYGCEPTGTGTGTGTATGTGSGTGTATGTGSNCTNSPAITVNYLSACSSQQWIVYEATAACFVDSTFQFDSNGAEVHYDNCLGTTLEDDYSIDGDVVTLHGYEHSAVLIGSDIELTYIGGQSADNVFKIRKGGSGLDTCSQPAVSSDYLSDCSSESWTVSGATNSCFNQSTFDFYSDGTEVHYDNCLGTTLTATYSIDGNVITLHGYDHEATVTGSNLLLTYIGQGSPNTFTISKSQ